MRKSYVRDVIERNEVWEGKTGNIKERTRSITERGRRKAGEGEVKV